MAEQTYDLTQMGAEVQAIINDANNVKGAGAQTTLTTEYVLLKDTDGQYHKILKSSFTEAIRDTFAGLLVNNDKGTTINQIAAIASGDFGSVTPVNLASVLGVPSANHVDFTLAANGTHTIDLGGVYHLLYLRATGDNVSYLVVESYRKVTTLSAYNASPEALTFSHDAGKLTITNNLNEALTMSMYTIV